MAAVSKNPACVSEKNGRAATTQSTGMEKRFLGLRPEHRKQTGYDRGKPANNGDEEQCRPRQQWAIRAIGPHWSLTGFGLPLLFELS